MSDAHNEHESAIKTPKQLIAVVAAAFIVPIVCIILLVNFVASGTKESAGLSEKQLADTTAARISPVADEGYKLVNPNAPKELQSGEAVFKSVCFACHATGALGAPKVGDAGAWGGRIAQGYDTLVSHAIKGIRNMPAKGGNADLDDVEVARAVVYMANQSGAKFKEPEVKAAAPAASAPAAK
jgi:cytochrome c5